MDSVARDLGGSNSLRCAIVCDQPGSTGIGSLARGTFELLAPHFPCLSIYSLAYRQGGGDEGAARPPGSSYGTGPVSSAIAQIRNQRSFRRLAQRNRLKLHLFGADYSLASAGEAVVATVHDFYFRPVDLRRPRGLGSIARDLSTNILNALTAIELATCTAIVVPSKYAQHQLQRRLGWASTVIYPWVDRTRFTTRDRSLARQALGLGSADKLLLNVGGDTWNKNLPTVARVTDRLPRGWRLLKAGAAVRESEKLIYLGRPSSAQYPLLFNAADAYLHPSLEEGFGLPLLEAMASGLPVVTADRATAREVLGSAALYVSDPTDESEYLSCLERLADNSEARRLIDMGLQRAQGFGQTRALDAYLDVYSRIFES